jgi:hypothetical protein
MSQALPPKPPDDDAIHRAVRLRLLTSLVALTAGVTALVIAILLLRTALG